MYRYVVSHPPAVDLGEEQVRGTKAAIQRLAARSDIATVEADFRAALIQPAGGSPPLENGIKNGIATGATNGPAAPDASRGTDASRGIGVTPGLLAIHADHVWHELGINGSGVIVASMDSGVDGNHPALHDRWRGATGHPSQESWLDVHGTTQFPHDPFGHGTHVTGTITGLGAATHDTIGVAWGAEWIACNPLGQESGPEFDNDVIHCFQWLADPDGNPSTVDDVPVVVQNSWKLDPSYPGDPPYTACDERWWEVIDNCEAAGVVVIFSAGNDGPGPHTVGSPPDRASTPYNVFSVGAVDATHYGWPYPIAAWSSRGPTTCVVPPEFAIKPEVAAPGVEIYSSVPGGGYAQSGWSGTSMSGPHVAGVVALMRSADPDMDPETVKRILLETARDEGPSGDDNAYGRGFIEAYEAVLRCLPSARAGLPAGSRPGLTVVPNPGVAREIAIRFRMDAPAVANVTIVGADGVVIQVLADRMFAPGEHGLIWNGCDDAGRRVAAGVYFCRLRQAGRELGAKVLILS